MSAIGSVTGLRRSASHPPHTPESRIAAALPKCASALPVAILARGQSLNVTVATYGAGLQIAVLGIEPELPDIEALAALTINAFAQLKAEALPPRKDIHR